jgi:hypothetical protein
MNKSKQLVATPEFTHKVARFAVRLQAERLRGYLADHHQGKTIDAISPDLRFLAIKATSVAVHYGKTWVRVDLDSSGRYMVDADGNIVGIKGYGVPHKGHQFGTLDTIDQWDWSSYSAVRKAVAK